MNPVAYVTYGFISNFSRLVAQVPLPPDTAQSLLIQSLDITLAQIKEQEQSDLLGIFQSDIIIRSAIIAGMADLRANPKLLDYVFGSLPADQLTNKEYGKKEVDQAKKWFLTTNIPVFMNTRIDEAKFPCISIALLESNEDVNTFADVHYQATEDLTSTSEADWTILAGPFTPLRYTASTGEIVVPSSVADSIDIAPGMVILDKIGRAFDVVDVSDKRTFFVNEGTIADFAGATIRVKLPSKKISLESAVFKEIYAIGCHAQNEAIYLTYLHSILTFILLRYKEALLEARGFERTSLASGDFSRNEASENELLFSRYIKITGFVRQYWPKAISDKLTSVTFQGVVDGAPSPTELERVCLTWIGNDGEETSLAVDPIVSIVVE